MPIRRTTVGKLLVNNALPEDMRSEDLTLDKKGLSKLLATLAETHPEDYRRVTHKLSQIGARTAYFTGGNSFGLKDLRQSRSAAAARQQLMPQLLSILDNDNLNDDQQEQLLLKAVGKLRDTQDDDVYNESLAEKNPLAMQVLSGSRGNRMNLASLRASDLLYTDHHGKVIPYPVLRSYGQGLSPAEYWAGTYGARSGTMSTKFATQDAGFLSKQLNQIAHRLVVTALDRDGDGLPDTIRGLPVDTNDPDNEGALLAHGVGGYDRNTILTPKILSDLKQRGFKRILTRSPAVSGAPDGGLYARDVGIREFGRLPVAGENTGLTAAQALSEPLSQAQLSAKHGGGVAGSSSSKAVGGFEGINQLVQVPKTFKGGAAHSTLDGVVQQIEDAHAGGKFVTIDNQKHYVGGGAGLIVKKGDRVEAGDVLSEGTPDPSIITQYKGLGEGKRYFIQAFRNAFQNAGIKSHRRNIELLARGLINHVRLTDEMGDMSPDDIVPYSALEHSYVPRDGHRQVRAADAVGGYLEKPYLHYSIGTKVRPSMLKDFQEFGVHDLDVHDDPPPFEPEMLRGMANLQHDPDWMTRMFGSGLKGSLLDAVHRGGKSDEEGTSYVPGLARGVDFGRQGKVITPKAPAFSKTIKLSADLSQEPYHITPAAVKYIQDVEKWREANQAAYEANSGPLGYTLTHEESQRAGESPLGFAQTMLSPLLRMGNPFQLPGGSDVQYEYADIDPEYMQQYTSQPRPKVPDQFTAQEAFKAMRQAASTGQPLNILPEVMEAANPAEATQVNQQAYTQQATSMLTPDAQTMANLQKLPVNERVNYARRLESIKSQLVQGTLTEGQANAQMAQMGQTLHDHVNVAPNPNFSTAIAGTTQQPMAPGPATPPQPQPQPQQIAPAQPPQAPVAKAPAPPAPAPVAQAPAPPKPLGAPLGPTNQPAATYRPGQGLLPIAQMFPQQTQQVIGGMGPFATMGLGALLDTSAVKTLTTPGPKPIGQLAKPAPARPQLASPSQSTAFKINTPSTVKSTTLTPG